MIERKNFYIRNEDLKIVMDALKWYHNRLGYMMFDHEADYPQELIDEEEQRYIKVGELLDKMETYYIARLREQRQ